jgi:prephenate dehydrogenase
VKKAGIVGVGLIGGSIAAGLEKAGWMVVGYDADPDVARTAIEAGLVSSLADSIESLANESFDVLVVAAPPEATVEILSALTTSIPVMDVAGVKTQVMEAALHLDSFAGTHPMAGRETSGPKAASAALFNGASWVLVDGASPSADSVATEVIETLGARVVRMSAATHDAAVGRISHLPQIVAGALLASVADTEGAMDLAAGSFRDLTRVAASLPAPWVELLKANSQAVLAAVGALKLQLSALEAAIVSDDDSLLNLMAQGRESRRALGAPVVAVRVALADTPGEIAKVGHALEVSKVDVRDIQMRHAPYGGGGVLTVSVRPGEEGTLAHALEAAGLLLVP